MRRKGEHRTGRRKIPGAVHKKEGEGDRLSLSRERPKEEVSVIL